MGKRNLLLDRYALIGQSATVRIRSKTPGYPERFAGHPCLKKAYGATAYSQLDRFRGATARYWSFKTGGSIDEYADFGYLNTSNVGFVFDYGVSPNSAEEARAQREANLIALNEGTIFANRPEFSTSLASWNLNAPFPTGGTLDDTTQLSRFFGEPTSFEFLFRNEAGDYLHTTDPSSPAADYTPGWHIPAAKTYEWGDYAKGAPGIRNLLVVYGDEGPWVLGSAAQFGQDTGQGLYRLNPGAPQFGPGYPASTAWTTYAAGTSNDPGGPAIANVYPGFLPQTGKMYYDHAHSFTSPVSPDSDEVRLGGAGVKTATIETSYNFFSKNYENASTTVSELLLPNRYIILAAIDGGPDNTDPGTDPLGDDVMNLYSRVSCLNNSFVLPTIRDQISRHVRTITSQDAVLDSQALAYGSTKTYIQNFYSHLGGDGDNINTIAQSVNPLTKHIGFTRDFIVDNFTNYNASTSFPLGISIEFGTRQSNENSRIALEVLDNHPNAYELLLQNIMIMNISPDHEWWQDPDSPYSDEGLDHPNRSLRGNHLFESTIDFSAVLSENAGTTYHGFGTWPSANGSWGQESVPNVDSGDYNLKALNLSHALAYNAIASIHPHWHLAEAPSPLTGPTDFTGVAFGDGMLVGRETIVQHGNDFDDTGQIHGENEDRVLFDSYRYAPFKSFINDLRNVIVQEERSYEDMLRGDEAYCETIAFRVAKYKASASGPDDSPIQNFYFPNVGRTEADNSDSATLDKIKYIDTQVQYGEKYVYKIYAYNLVIGTQYHYTGLLYPGGDAHQGDALSLADQRDNMLVAHNTGLGNNDIPYAGIAKFDAHQFTSLQIIEAPYYTYNPVEVRDLPPVFPEVEVVPFKGVSNKIKLLLKTQNVKYSFREPEKFKINDADIDKYGCIRSAQLGGASKPGALVFGSDDTEITFEIYRMTEKPLSYVDFDGHLLASVPGVTPSGERAVNIGYDDTIKPNRKYYYTFRTIDYHDAISIPSPIYQVEIVDDNGRMYPIVGVFYPNNHVDRSVNVMKPLRKYLQISPAMAQIAANMTEFQTAYDNGKISVTEAPPPGLLGTRDADGSVWQQEPTTDQAAANETPPQKIFKIRLTSRQTGKKIDLNVKFIQTSTINPEGLD
jgi:hypothetical protein